MYSCYTKQNGRNGHFPSTQLGRGIDLGDIPLEFGQRVRMQYELTTIRALVIDFDQFEGGIWVGMCFKKEGQLMGRKIPYGTAGTTCWDFVYVHQDGIGEVEVIEGVNLAIEKIGVGSGSQVRTVQELQSTYEYAIDRRKEQPSPCGPGLINPDAAAERYFSLLQFLK